MRKRKTGRKFSRKAQQRKSLLRGLAEALILNNRIRTTQAKAKELRPFIEKFITRAKVDSLYTRRYLGGYFPRSVVKKLVEEIAPQYKQRRGGYTRIVKLGPRKSDGAEMAFIELL